MNTPNITPGPWATSKDAVPDGHVQITVYDEPTGKRVATVFERPENAQAIAATHQTLEALQMCLIYTAAMQQDGRPIKERKELAKSVHAIVLAALTAAGYTHGKDA